MNPAEEGAADIPGAAVGVRREEGVTGAEEVTGAAEEEEAEVAKGPGTVRVKDTPGNRKAGLYLVSFLIIFVRFWIKANLQIAMSVWQVK